MGRPITHRLTTRRDAIVEGAGGRTRVRVETSAIEVRVTVQPLPGAARDAAYVRLVPAQGSMWTSPGLPRAWTMIEGLPIGGNAPRGNDPFVALAAAGLANVGDARPGGGPVRPSTPRASSAASAIRSAVRLGAIEAARRCDPRARRAVLRFPPSMRWRLYRWLLHEPSGRLHALTSECPGLVALMLGAAETDAMAPLVRQVMVRARAGDRAPALVDVAIETWENRLDRLASERRRSGLPWANARAFAVAEDWSPAQRDRMRQRKRLLVTRAGPRVPPATLLLPPPRMVLAEDVPQRVRDNAAWFGLMHASPYLLGAGAPQDAVALQALTRFVSRNALRIADGVSPRDARARVRALVHYVRETGFVASQSTAPSWLIAEACGRCVEQLGPVAFAPAVRAALDDPSTPLPEPVAPGFVADGIWVHPLRRADEVLAAARAMRDRAPPLLSGVLAGGRTLYRVEVGAGESRSGGEWLLVELARDLRGLELRRVSGVARAEPSPAAWRALRPWFESIGLGDPPGATAGETIAF